MKRVLAVLSLVVTGLLTFGLATVCGWWAGKLAVARNRDKEWGWIVGSWFMLLGVIVFACLPDRPPTAAPAGPSV